MQARAILALVLGMGAAGCTSGVESRLEEARSLLFRQETDKAADAYRALLFHLEGKDGEAARSARIEALSRIGDLTYLQKKDPRGAAESYRRLIELAPTSEEAFWAREKLAEIAHRHLDDPEEAIAHWQALAQSGRPESDRFAYLVAKAYFEKKDYEQSRRESEAVARTFPESRWAQDALFLHATTWQFEGEHEKAIEAFEGVEARWPAGELAARARFQVGRCRMALEDADGALSDYLQALKRHPDPEAVQAEIARARRKVAEWERIRNTGEREAFRG